MKKILLITILFLLPFSSFAQSVMSSDEYKMQSDSINFAGLFSTSTNYQVEDSLGEMVSGTTTSTTYAGYLGYQFMGFADADTEDPTAPASVVATAISTTEVELTWDASTDNIAVDRYYIYRDNIRIDDVATFPRSFSDSGLTANTTYSYNITAVDDSGNESARSSTTTATTLSTSTATGQGGSRSVVITNFNTTSNDNNVLVSFDTSLTRTAEIYWGRDLTYSDGFMIGSVQTSHNFLVDNLLPQTFYHLKIVLKDAYGATVSYENLSFRTLSVALSRSPVNVSEFLAKAQVDAINLSWVMPIDSRVVGVRIVRREDFYPATPTDGEIVFETGEDFGVTNFADTNVLPGRDYFYTIFTQDLAGNTSSGVVASSRILLPGEVLVENPLDRLLPAGSVDPLIAKLEVEDFLFIQSGDSVDVSGGSVFVRGDKNTTIALKYYRVPEVLKTIAVTLVTRTEPQGSFTFILRPNRDKTRYEATIGSLGQNAVYTMRVDIIDYKNQGLKTIRGTLEVVSPTLSPFAIPNNFKYLLLITLGVGMVLLVLYRSLFVRTRRLPLIKTT